MTAERERHQSNCNARPGPSRDDDLRNRAGGGARGQPDGTVLCAWCCSAADATHSGLQPPSQSRDARLLLPADKRTAFSPSGAAWDSPPVTQSSTSPRLANPLTHDARRREVEDLKAIQRQKDVETIQRRYWEKSPRSPRSPRKTEWSSLCRHVPKPRGWPANGSWEAEAQHKAARAQQRGLYTGSLLQQVPEPNWLQSSAHLDRQQPITAARASTLAAAGTRDAGGGGGGGGGRFIQS